MRACWKLPMLGMFVVYCAEAQIETTIQAQISVQPYSTARSQLFPVEAGDIVMARPAGNEKLELEFSVYTEGQTLAAKEDPEQNSLTHFEWMVRATGTYYMFVRNLTGVEGTFSVTVRRGAKAVAGGTPLFAEVRVFYASARKPQSDPSRAPYYSEREVSSEYSVGTAIVTIPRTHRIGELETAAIYRLVDRDNKSEFVTLGRVTPFTDRTTFFNLLSAQVRTTERQEALVFIHGFNVSFEDAALRTAQMSYDLGFGGGGVFFTWPSHYSRIPTPGEYTAAGQNAAACAGALTSFLKDLRRRTGSKTVFLIAHSMGNRLLATALKQIGEEGGTDRFREVALFAPDISAEIFRTLAASMRLSADRITLYASSNDEALKVSQRLNRGARAGQSGPQLVVVPGVDTVDASDVRSDAFTFDHSYYADNIVMLSELYHLLRGDPPQIRFGLERVDAGAAAHWRFRRYVR